MSRVQPGPRAQPTVRSILVYGNGDAHTDARRVLVHDRRVRDMETLLREVTGRVRAPFGAVRRIYTPRAGHRVDALEHVRHGGKYVAAGTEKFKKLDYLQIGSRKKQTIQSNGLVKAAPQNRMVVSARFLKPIKEPCTIFVVANGDLLNPAVRVLVHSRLLNQYERILEMLTEKMGLRILGGVRSLCSLEGVPLTDGKDLENGQFYVAVGRDKFKRLPYADSLFSKAVGMRRSVRSKAASLPPIDKYARQNGQVLNGGSKSNPGDEVKSIEPIASLVRQISQARLMALRKKRRNLSNSNSTQENDEAELQPAGEAAESKDQQVYSSEDKDSEEEEAAAEEEEATTREEDEAAAKEEEAVAEQEAPAEEKEAAEEEEAEPADEEAAAEEEEAEPEDEEEKAEDEEEKAEDEEQEAAAEEQEAAAEEEEAEEEEAAAEEEEAAAKEEEAAAGDDMAAAGHDMAADERHDMAAAAHDEAAAERDDMAAAAHDEAAAGDDMAAAEHDEAAAGDNEAAVEDEAAAAGEEPAGE